MSRSINLDAAVDVVAKWFENMGLNGDICLDGLKSLPSAQPEPKNKLISEIEGKTPEETYDFLVWLLNDYGMQFTDSRQAVIEWLGGVQEC